jgi:hypothetical protein
VKKRRYWMNLEDEEETVSGAAPVVEKRHWPNIYSPFPYMSLLIWCPCWRHFHLRDNIWMHRRVVLCPLHANGLRWDVYMWYFVCSISKEECWIRTSAARCESNAPIYSNHIKIKSKIEFLQRLLPGWYGVRDGNANHDASIVMHWLWKPALERQCEGMKTRRCQRRRLPSSIPEM